MYKVISYKEGQRIRENDYHTLPTARTESEYVLDIKLADKVEIYALAEVHTIEMGDTLW